MRALDDLVSDGKVRYIGFSDTPAWKVAEAQVTASFRGWNPLVALQIEYSLLERTPEAEVSDEDIFGNFKSFQMDILPIAVKSIIPGDVEPMNRPTLSTVPPS